MQVILTDQPGAKSWPITGASFILMHRVQEKPEVAAEVLKFFDWCFRSGGGMAAELDYVPMPAAVVKLIRAQWKSLRDAAGKPVYQLLD
jgi:phosphate transport system substrate-binding protein